MANNYDNAAPFYDRLSQLVFGKALVHAQVYLLQFIPPGSSILIVGGGSGWILEELTRLQSSGLKITYVELSAKMMAISAKRNIGNNSITFINSAVEEVALQSDFNIVITPFLFDNFSRPTAQKVFDHLNESLKPDGLWLYADFETTGKWWQPLLLRAMHLFFKMLCGIEASRLPEVNQLFVAGGYISLHSKAFFGDFIKAVVYSRLR